MKSLNKNTLYLYGSLCFVIGSVFFTFSNQNNRLQLYGNILFVIGSIFFLKDAINAQ